MNKSNKLFLAASLILTVSSFSYKTLAANTEDGSKHVEFGLNGDKTTNKKPVLIKGAVDIGAHSDFSGEVALTNIPKLTFDSSAIDNKKIFVKANEVSGKTPGIRVDDVSGEGQGWTVKVKASEFVSTTDANVKLNGAKLIFPKKEAVSFANINKTTGKPSVNRVELPFDNNTSGIVLVEASKGAGMGAWEVAYEDKVDNKGIEMELPVGQLLGTYKATVTYTLTVGEIKKDAAK